MFPGAVQRTPDPEEPAGPNETPPQVFEYPGAGGRFIHASNSISPVPLPCCVLRNQAAQDSCGLAHMQLSGGGGDPTPRMVPVPPASSSVLAGGGDVRAGPMIPALTRTTHCRSDPSQLPGTWALVMVGPGMERETALKGGKTTTGSPVGSCWERPGDVLVPHSQGRSLGPVHCQGAGSFQETRRPT